MAGELCLALALWPEWCVLFFLGQRFAQHVYGLAQANSGCAGFFTSISSTFQTRTAEIVVQLRPPDCPEDAVPMLGSTVNGTLR